MPTPPKPHPLKPGEVRHKANYLAWRRRPHTTPFIGTSDNDRGFREGFKIGYELGVAYAERMIAKHGERR